MGSSTSKENSTNYIDKINEINIDDLDLSKIDNLQLKAIKELGNKIKEIEKKKSDRIMYKKIQQLLGCRQTEASEAPGDQRASAPRAAPAPSPHDAYTDIQIYIYYNIIII